MYTVTVLKDEMMMLTSLLFKLV